MTYYNLFASRVLGHSEIIDAVKSTFRFDGDNPVIICGEEETTLTADCDFGIIRSVKPGEFPLILELYTEENLSEEDWQKWTRSFCRHCGISALISDDSLNPYSFFLLDGVNPDVHVYIDDDFHEQTGGYSLSKSSRD